MLAAILSALYAAMSFLQPAPAASEVLPDLDIGQASYTYNIPMTTTTNIVISSLVKDELAQIFKEIEATGYQLKDIKTLRPVAAGRFSWHYYGLAVDINPKQNPCLGCGDQESLDWPGGPWVAGKNGALTKQVVSIFKKYGWCWGGDWCSKKDYMHFSKPVGLPQYDECSIGTCPYFK